MRAVRLTTTMMLALASTAWPAADACAEDAVELSAEYVADYISGLAGDPGKTEEFVDHLSLSASFDLNRLAGWRDTRLFVNVINNSGGAPNDELATLQGVDNIEVSRQRARLYELWLETVIGGVNVRGGLYDLNSEFYANESAGLLIAPAFGIGSELAATGPNGPSIFPSTALALRLAMPLSPQDQFKIVVLNAEAGVLGDPNGVDVSLDDGALIVVEWSHDGAVDFNLGGWTYTDEQADIRLPEEARAAGVYATAERVLWNAAEPRETTAFIRIGLADGDTSPYVGGWQTGILVGRVFASRPESQFSFGVYQGRLGDKFRANLEDDGIGAADAETGIELTYSDQVTPWLRLQPDLQLVRNPGGDASRDDLFVGVLRLAISL